MDISAFSGAEAGLEADTPRLAPLAAWRTSVLSPSCLPVKCKGLNETVVEACLAPCLVKSRLCRFLCLCISFAHHPPASPSGRLTALPIHTCIHAHRPVNCGLTCHSIELHPSLFLYPSSHQMGVSWEQEPCLPNLGFLKSEVVSPSQTGRLG